MHARRPPSPLPEGPPLSPHPSPGFQSRPPTLEGLVQGPLPAGSASLSPALSLDTNCRNQSGVTWSGGSYRKVLRGARLGKRTQFHASCLLSGAPQERAFWDGGPEFHAHPLRWGRWEAVGPPGQKDAGKRHSGKRMEPHPRQLCPGLSASSPRRPGGHAETPPSSSSCCLVWMQKASVLPSSEGTPRSGPA